MNSLILALDFGGTKLTAALFEAERLTPRRMEAKLREEHARPSLRSGAFALTSSQRVFTPAGADAAHELSAMLAMADGLLAGQKPSAVGVSFGGPVDYREGVVRLSHHVAGWANYPLRDRLAERFGAPAVVDNDANVAALGEHRYGAGRGVDDLMYITVSTGVGGGWVLGGRPWRGHDGMAGEIGHTVADANGPVCLCGKRGCVERLASGPYMAADYAAAPARADHRPRTTDDSQQSDRGPSPVVRRPLTGQDVAEQAAAGDALASKILMRGARALGVGIGNAANLVNPQRFVLGGGVTKAGDAWWAETRRAAVATALPEVMFDIVPAELGDNAPLWGALALALEETADYADYTD